MWVVSAEERTQIVDSESKQYLLYSVCIDDLQQMRFLFTTFFLCRFALVILIGNFSDKQHTALLRFVGRELTDKHEGN